MERGVVYAAPLFFGLLLKFLAWYIFNKGASNAGKKVLLDYFPGSHALAEHEELALLLIFNVLGEENDSEVADSALDFGLGLLEIKEFIDVLHLGD